MKAPNITAFSTLKKSQLWLLGISSSLVAIYMTLLAKSGDGTHLKMSVLFCIAVGSLLWKKRQNLILERGAIASVLGASIIAALLWRSTDLEDTNFLRLFPFISAIGVSLIASGFRGFKQYRQELIILFFLGVPSVLASFTDISPFTAKFSAFLLWYFGFHVSLQEVYINLPTGGVKVHAGCSGMEAMTYLLGIAVICLIIFPIKQSQQTFVPIVAVILGFVVNAFRVALMTVLVASGHREAFNYWHEGDGSLIFGAIAEILFGAFYLLLVRNFRTKQAE